jgi:hypothetical protein
MLAALCGWNDDDQERQRGRDAVAGTFATLNLEGDTAPATSQTRRLHDFLRKP